MPHIFEKIIALIGLLISMPLLVLVIIIGIFDTGSPIFIQTRVGIYQNPFKLIKFRTMRKDTASVASHLANNSSITKFGSFLRRTKIDELPQLINVLKGDMSFVGPRPNLYNQNELIEEREKLGIYNFRPGITGLAQIKNIDMSTPKLLAQTDFEMLNNISLKNYFYYVVKTVTGSGKGDAIK